MVKYCLLFLLIGCLPDIGKFQHLAFVQLSGTIVWTDGTDLDLDLDPEFSGDFIDNFPLFGGVVHCERYGIDGARADPVVFIPSLGTHLIVSGFLVLDNYVHEGEPGNRKHQRGLFQAFSPKPELHPFWPSTIGKLGNPQYLDLTFYEETYSPDWFWNKFWRVAGAGVGDPVTRNIYLRTASIFEG